MKALFIGRFQPFHNGHVSVIKKILKECDFIVIGVGSAQSSYTVENPFTAGERTEMIMAALGKEFAGKFCVIPIEDVNFNSVWVSHVESLVPKFERVYSNNSLVKLLFSDRGYEVSPIEFFDREKISGTSIRKLMLEGGDWQALIPKEVRGFIEDLKGEERVRLLSESDNVPGV